MSELTIRVCFQASLSRAFLKDQPRIKRTITPRQHVRSLQRKFQELAVKLMLRLPPEAVLTVSSQILLEADGDRECAAPIVISKLQVLRAVKTLNRREWRSLKRACRIALVELADTDADAERVYSRIKDRGSHDFNGSQSPLNAVVLALEALGSSDQNAFTETLDD